MGKTSFSMNIGEHVAIEQGCRWRSSRWKWARCSWPCVCWARYSTSIDAYRQVVADDWPRVTHAVQLMQDAQVYIDETPALSSMECAPARGAWRASAGS